MKRESYRYITDKYTFHIIAFLSNRTPTRAAYALVNRGDRSETMKFLQRLFHVFTRNEIVNVDSQGILRASRTRNIPQGTKDYVGLKKYP
jgi:hypothetical protein